MGKTKKKYGFASVALRIKNFTQASFPCLFDGTGWTGWTGGTGWTDGRQSKVSFKFLLTLWAFRTYIYILVYKIKVAANILMGFKI